jgi:hypothetical protein
MTLKKNNYTIVAMLTSIIYWSFDSLLHKLIFDKGDYEIIPSDINELWMRILIVILLIGFGIYADRHTKMLLEKENEKRAIYLATVSSTQHIVNNLLNQMQYFKLVADQTQAFNEETTEMYLNAMKEGKALVEKLSKVEELTAENIGHAVSPHNRNEKSLGVQD